MTLRGKLFLLLTGFAGFAVASAAATIYGVQAHVELAAERFERTLDRGGQVDQLRSLLAEQLTHLHELTLGREHAADRYFTSREAFLTTANQFARFHDDSTTNGTATNLARYTQALTEASDRCLQLLQAGDQEGAIAVLTDELEASIAPPFEELLRKTRDELDRQRQEATAELGRRSGEVFIMTLAVAALATLFVVVALVLIRRWLLAPVAALQTATRRFAEGDLTVRVSPSGRDELAELGQALNRMAEALAGTQAELRASEAKHRALFRNLRDAVVICDEQGHILEYHDGETRILGVEEGEHIGRHLLDVWPEWRGVTTDWGQVIESVIGQGKRYRAADANLGGDVGMDNGVFADFLAYRIEDRGRYCAAIVVRDVGGRRRLERKLRRAETMEAVGTLAGGLAHDFNNLLTSVIGTLSLLATEVKGSPHAERVATALKACWQAAGLSRRLLNFAGGLHGDPQTFAASEAIELIMESLDPNFLANLQLRKELHRDVNVCMDRDQFTQIVLNLVRNAKDAMPDGGDLFIRVETETTPDPENGGVMRPFALLTVRDSGAGMTPEIQQRIFEPFFTTKSRAARRGRGMGMAIVYTAVKNAGGFLRVDSRPGEGTSFRVYLPVTAAVEETPSSGALPPATRTN